MLCRLPHPSAGSVMKTGATMFQCFCYIRSHSSYPRRDKDDLSKRQIDLFLPISNPPSDFISHTSARTTSQRAGREVTPYKPKGQRPIDDRRNDAGRKEGKGGEQAEGSLI